MDAHFGRCVLLEDGCLASPNFPASHDNGGSCEVAIHANWTGVLFVEHLSVNYGDAFNVDGEFVTGYRGQVEGPHGMAARHSLLWSPFYSSGSWKLCQVNSLPPWRVTSGSCYITAEGCFESSSAHAFLFDGLDYCSVDSCDVEISTEWEGSLVAEAYFDWRASAAIQTVNGLAHSLRSTEDLALAGVDGMLSNGFSWYQPSGCHRLTICPMVHTSLQGPWGNEPSTCTALGDPCPLPFQLNGLSFAPCTQQLSDPYDTDQDGSLHNGHPQCHTDLWPSLCGPCSCEAGEEQTYNLSSIYPHTTPVELVRCAACAAGRFKSLGGSGASDSCEVCLPGGSSPSGATACTTCLSGMFNDYEMLQCASCQAGFFGAGFGLTVCQECADGSYASAELQTACDSCPQGSTLVAKDAGCQQCSPGSFQGSSTTCSPFDAGWYQNMPGQTVCHQCSAVLDPEGPNPELWTTMSRNGHMEWQEMAGSRSVRDCGCSPGAWVDALGQCQECGVGLSCKGMGEVEVLPGYFASAGSAGFVWQCHGADWRRCPGGRPGTCAPQRLNTSIACEECEPYTRGSNDGPCKARRVLLTLGSLKSSLLALIFSQDLSFHTPHVSKPVHWRESMEHAPFMRVTLAERRWNSLPAMFNILL